MDHTSTDGFVASGGATVAEEFVSVCVTPDPGTFDAAAMARGEPGLPAGFTWDGRHYAIVRVLAEWKESEPDGHRRGAELYYRKRWFRVLVESGEVMTLYALRQVKASESSRKRWWLFSVERGG